MYDCSCWQIDQSMYDDLVGKQPAKKSLFGFGKKKDKKKKEEEEVEVKPSDLSVDLLSDDGGSGGSSVEMSGIKGGDLKGFFGESAVKDSDNENNKTQEVSDPPQSAVIVSDVCCVCSLNFNPMAHVMCVYSVVVVAV